MIANKYSPFLCFDCYISIYLKRERERGGGEKTQTCTSPFNKDHIKNSINSNISDLLTKAGGVQEIKLGGKKTPFDFCTC